MAKKKQGHRWWSRKRTHWMTYCAKCGLVWLNNEATKKAIRAACEGDKYKDRELFDDELGD